MQPISPDQWNEFFALLWLHMNGWRWARRKKTYTWDQLSRRRRQRLLQRVRDER